MALPSPETDNLTPLISRIFSIESITWGTQEEKYHVQYIGRLKKDSIEAYDELAAAVKPHNLTPLFREEEGSQVILLMDGVIDPQPSNPWTNLILFILTLFSMLFAGALFSYDGPPPENELELIMTSISNLQVGIPFGLSLLAILLAHEFGHYLAARFNKTAVTLPYFIPFPISPFGTMGAFIRLKEPPKNRRVLHDIGIAGPLAGLLVTIPILLIGLSLSTVEEFPKFIPEGQGITMEGNSIVYMLAKYVTKGEWLPAPQSYNGVSPFLYWVKFFFTGSPLPLGGRDVFIHPMAWAGWAGLLVTALNLIPAGQLDGGHLLYVLFGKKAQRALPIILVSLALLGLVWNGWWLWVFLVYFLGRAHAEPLDQITKLDKRRKALAVLGLVIFVLIFTPVPLRLVMGPIPGL